jgi:hypothetical protein
MIKNIYDLHPSEADATNPMVWQCSEELTKTKINKYIMLSSRSTEQQGIGESEDGRSAEAAMMIRENASTPCLFVCF